MKRILWIFALIMSLLPGLAQAQNFDMVVKAEILPGWRGTDGVHVAGLKISLNPGWKTYWRTPGDAGIPPIFTWRGSKHADKVEVVWPTPQVFAQNGMTSVGYEQDVVIPLRVSAAKPGANITLKGKLDIGVCRDICVPQTLKVKAVLPADAGKRNAQIASALADRPLSGSEAGVGHVTCVISPTTDGMRITAAIPLPSTGGQEWAVVETDNPEIWVAEATSQRRGGTLHVQTEVMHVEGDPFVLDRSALRLTILGSSHAVDIRGCAAG